MKFSVITSCFNSSKTLWRTYESLVSLKRNDFEWILIDDFSNDNGATKDLIALIARQAPFQVKFKFLDKNYFGARSTYEACLIASGEYACILDHDDEITCGAMQVVLNHSQVLKGFNIAGVAGRCLNRNGNLIGKLFPVNNFIGREGVVRFKWGITEEIFQFTKVNILKKYFENFKPGYTNGFVWAKISRDYNYLFVNDVFRIYDTDLPTSYSNTKELHIYYPAEKSAALQATLEYYNEFLIWNLIFSIRLAASSVRHRFNADMRILSNPPRAMISKVIYILSVPLGYLKYKKFL